MTPNTIVKNKNCIPKIKESLLRIVNGIPKVGIIVLNKPEFIFKMIIETSKRNIGYRKRKDLNKK